MPSFHCCPFLCTPSVAWGWHPAVASLRVGASGSRIVRRVRNLGRGNHHAPVSTSVLQDTDNHIIRPIGPCLVGSRNSVSDGHNSQRAGVIAYVWTKRDSTPHVSNCRCSYSMDSNDFLLNSNALIRVSIDFCSSSNAAALQLEEPVPGYSWSDIFFSCVRRSISCDILASSASIFARLASNSTAPPSRRRSSSARWCSTLRLADSTQTSPTQRRIRNVAR